MGGPCFCFSKVKEREPVVLRSLTKICEYLNVSPQHRRVVRFTLCRQITHQHIWRSTLQELLKELKLDIDAIETPKHRIEIGKQIISCCSKFLNDSESSFGLDSPSWMRLTTTKKPDSPIHKWGDVLEMFNDLTSCLKKEQRLALHVLKLEAMKEGLYQIKDVFLDRDIGYKRARQQECLVQKKLSQSLGHSSECLFTLLLYNLYGRVRNIEVDLCGGVCNSGGDVCLSIGKVSSATDMKMITRGIRHLDKALGLFKFVWEVAGMKKGLHLRGHIWNVGGEERVLQYRGNTFFVHGIKFPRRENFNYEY
ncbi:hypothetical protein AMTR_s00081p00020200 [Amborella trichopoda]|uniref:Uncharacterized protein n=1 Tax=Amborella trichopoda TaxID=13333 RepID=W1PBQ9_AMBTC|nr:hypothetical protein AMTR_s00081p00020200 [Amborella trichopoda]